jgi:uncharacterized membrane protein YfcA
MAAVFLFCGAVLGGVAGWRLASLLPADFLGVIHTAAVLSGAWVGLLLGFLAAAQVGRWRLRRGRTFRRTRRGAVR